MIFVLGSLNIDYTVRLKRVPKKGETAFCDSFDTFCGGKGANQAIAAAKLGGRAALVGCVGGDENGKRLAGNLLSHGVDGSFVSVKDGAASGVAMVFVEKCDNRIVVAKNANGLVSEADIDAALKNATAADILVAQLEIPAEAVTYAFSAAKAKGMTTILNPAPATAGLSKELYLNTDIIISNETETEILTGIYPADIVHTALAVKKLYSYGVKAVVITLGQRGAAVAVNQEITEIEPVKVKAVDTTAAGDTFVGAVAVRLSGGENLVEACKFANCAASITVTRKGAADSIPNKDEVEKLQQNLKTSA